MKENKPEIKTEIKTPEEILKKISSQFKDLGLQASKALTKKRDAETYRKKLRERAQLIVDLPLKIQESVKNGNIFPESEMGYINNMSEMAKEVLKEDKDFSLGLLLTNKGEHKTNYLDELIETLYPIN